MREYDVPAFAPKNPAISNGAYIFFTTFFETNQSPPNKKGAKRNPMFAD